MKKLVLVLAIGLIAFVSYSCKREPVEVTGVVTYFFNKAQGDKADIGAKVYLIEGKIDTLSKALQISHFREDIEKAEMSLEDQEVAKNSEYPSVRSYYSEDIVAFSKQTIEDSKEAIKTLLADFKMSEVSLIMKAYSQKSRFLSALNKEVLSSSVDATGRYALKVPKGKYTLVIVSNNREGSGLLEIEGKMFIEEIEIKEPLQKDVRFGL